MNTIVIEYKPGERVKATVDGVRVMAARADAGYSVWRCNRHGLKRYPHCAHLHGLAEALGIEVQL